MKRSAKISLSLMALPASALLIGCGDDTDALVFKDLQECKNSGLIDSNSCQNAYALAVNEHQRTAPRFSSMSDCEEDFGRGSCQDLAQASPGESSGSWFIPAMAGFMASQIINNSMQGNGFYMPMGGHMFRYHSQPLYRPIGSSSWTTASAERVGSGTGRVKVSEKATWSPEKSTTFKRGGFGSKASARGSWGSFGS